METAVEDDEIAERMDRGRKALLAEGGDEVGPYQEPFEVKRSRISTRSTAG